MTRIAYVNGSYVPEADAKVSIFDRGFLFADGVYEVTPIVNSKLVDYDAHMERLDRSLNELQMAWPCSKDDMKAMHVELIKRNKLNEGIIYMQVTRGVADRMFNFPKDITSSLVAFPQVMKLVDNPNARTGVKVITTPDIRWLRRDIKSIMLLAPVLGKQDAYEKGAAEGWMVEDGFITEGTSSNAYIVKDHAAFVEPHSRRLHKACADALVSRTWCQNRRTPVHPRRSLCRRRSFPHISVAICDADYGNRRQARGRWPAGSGVTQTARTFSGRSSG
jgi:D-alanine transaminase